MPPMLPAFARIDRTLPLGTHRYVEVLPGVAESPALARIAPAAATRADLLARACVQIRGRRGYAFVDVEIPCIVVAERYYRRGEALDLYLDLLHELTHLRQLDEGLDLWDERFAYVDRPTEVEGYAVAIEEGRRLGMTDGDILRHLSNPWMSATDVATLVGHVNTFLSTGVLINLELAKQPAQRRTRRPW